MCLIACLLSILFCFRMVLSGQNEFDKCKPCETGYGHWSLLSSSTCFTQFGYSSENWGWSLGPFTCNDFSDGTIILDIWVGAAQCDYLTKGEFGGQIYLDYDCNNNELIVTFDCETTLWVFNEIHLYVGNNPLASDENGNPTIIPGKYPYSRTDAYDDITYKVEKYIFETITIDEPFYIVAHSDICKCDEKPSPQPTLPTYYPSMLPTDTPQEATHCEYFYGYAKDNFVENTCLTTLGYNDFGWSVGPFEDSDFTVSKTIYFDFYQAPSNWDGSESMCNDISQSINVGYGTIFYDSLPNSFTFRYVLNEPFVGTIFETYVGNDAVSVSGQGINYFDGGAVSGHFYSNLVSPPFYITAKVNVCAPEAAWNI